MKILLIFFISFIFNLSSLIIPRASAQTIIDGGVIPQSTLDTSAPAPTPEPKQSVNGLFTGKNYQIQVGFENLNSAFPLHFSISENLIDYGELSATDPILRTNILSISSPSTKGYTVQGFENHSLKHNSSPVFIPDTTCDNGICSETTSQPWNGPLTYGFGYRCDPSTSSEQAITNYCLSDVSDTNSYKQFSQPNNPQIITQANQNASAQVTYKINISGTQAPQFYSNQVTFIAVPNF